MLKSIISFFIAFIFSFSIAAQTGWPGIKFGPYAVGFKVVHTFDYARTFKAKTDSLGNEVKGERARPIQMAIWYPAVETKAKRSMSYEDYLMLFATEQTQGRLNDSVKKAAINEMIAAGFSKNLLEQSIALPVNAVREASPIKQKFPLIVYGCSWAAPSFENSVLFELLASNGYVVVSSPSMGFVTRDMTGDVTGIESQVEDMQFILNKATELPYVDAGKIAVAGFSWGGLADVLLQQRNNKIMAVLSFDGSIAGTGGMKHFKDCAFCDFSKMDVPFMYMSQKGRKNNPFYDKLNYSNAYYLQFHKNQHRDFASMFITVVNEYPTPEKKKLAAYCYSLQSAYTLNFFNAFVKGDEAAKKYLQADPKERAIADTIMTMQRKQAKPLPPSESYFMNVLQRDGVDKAIALAQQIRADDPEYHLFKENTINSKAYGLLKASKIEEAISLFKLNALAYPESANVYDSLGDAYEKKGDKALAIENYQKALTIDPLRGTLREKIERLSK